MMAILLCCTTVVYPLTTIIAARWHALWYLSTNILNIRYVVDTWHTLHSTKELLEVLTIDRYLLTSIIVVVLLLL